MLSSDFTIVNGKWLLWLFTNLASKNIIVSLGIALDSVISHKEERE